MRIIFALIAGILVSLALVAGFEGVSATLYRVSGDVVSSDRATLVALMASIPFPAELIVVAGWLIAPFAGAWLCLRIGDHVRSGWIVTGVFLLGSLYEQLTLPYPVWMQVCSVALPLLGGWLAQRLHSKPYPGEPLLG